MKELSTAELRRELERREKEAEAIRDEKRKRSQVTVYCPECDGAGQTRNYGMRVACGEYDEYSTCGMCRGRRTIVARLVNP